MAAIKMHLRYCSPCYIQKDGLLPPTELLLTGYVTQCYHHLDNGEAALPYTQRMAELVEGEYGVSSKGVCQNAGIAIYDLHTHIRAFPEAHAAIKKALIIMEDLELQHDELYCALRAAEGQIHYAESRYKDALVSYNKAKVFLWIETEPHMEHCSTTLDYATDK